MNRKKNFQFDVPEKYKYWNKIPRGGGRGWEAFKALLLKYMPLLSIAFEIYSIVFNRFLRAPVGIRGLWVGYGRGEFIWWGAYIL